MSERFERRRRPLRRAAALLVVVAVAAGCNAILGIEDPIDRPTEAGGCMTNADCLAGELCDNGVCVSSEGGSLPDASGPDVSMPEAAPPMEAGPDAPIEPPCEERAVDEAAGLFVDKSGSDGPNCGAVSLPCQTIQHTLDRAGLIGKSVVYVAASSSPYVESITMPEGVRVEGAWGAVGETWTPICTTQASEAVIVQAPFDQAVTVTVDGLGSGTTVGTAELAWLTVRSKAQADVLAAESLYGIFVRGATTRVVLERVNVDMANAGDGAPGTAGSPGADGATTGCLPASDGATPPDGAPGAGAPAGTFTSDGYEPPPVAETGQSGQDGHNGSGAPTPSCFDCVWEFLPIGGQCQLVGNVCPESGLPGCGGKAGTAGTGGSSAGSSIGIYIWDARVEALRGALGAGDAGNGGNGGDIGAGGSGMPGAPGPESYCPAFPGSPCAANYAPPSPPGGPGGNGSAGGRGGGGAGGYSYAVYRGGAASFTQTGVAFTHGSAGRGGNRPAPPVPVDGGLADAAADAGGASDAGPELVHYGANGAAADIGP
jgi:hypothetical protein